MKPMRGGGGSMRSGARAAMRSTAPRGLRVQRAIQSTKSRKGWLSGGQGFFSITDLRLPPSPGRAAQTTPTAVRVPSGMATKSPGRRSSSGGAR